MMTYREYVAHSGLKEGETLAENRARCALAHREYYAQFVSEPVKNLVISHIGLGRILKSKDPYFNDIPMKEWDDLDGIVRLMTSRKVRESGGFLSLSTSVCILKEAARQLKSKAMEV